MLKKIFLGLLLFASVDVCAWRLGPPCRPHGFYVGPEGFYMTRKTRAGAHQDGLLYGGRAGYDRLRRKAAYYGMEGHYARGTLRGRSGGSLPTESKLTEWDIEARIGYAFHLHYRWCPTVAPFIGAGYFHENNRFVPPTLMTVTFKTHFSYIALGFVSHLTLSRCWGVGLNVKGKFMVEGRNTTCDDPDVDDATVIIGNKIGVAVDVPLTYYFCKRGRGLSTSFVPFYRFRHYGGREGYPFDFFGTHYNSYGARLTVNWVF